MLRPRRIHLLPPVSYQGGKRRQAPEIVRHMALDPETPFYDLCCGSGAVSLELISRGHNPAKITMIDAGPWGDVWRMVGRGEFDLETMRFVLNSIPERNAEIPAYLLKLRDTASPSDSLAPYHFLAMQAGAFGGTPVRERDGKWLCRAFTKCKDDGEARSCLSTSREEIARRFGLLVRYCRGVKGVRSCAHELTPGFGSVVYADPPYRSTPNDYRLNFLPEEYAARVGVPVFVSEAVPLTPGARLIRRRKKGSFRGNDARANRNEYLSLFNADWPTPDVERFEQQSLFG